MRLKLIYDIISGIRAIKCYGWETKLHERVGLIRAKEVTANLLLACHKLLTYTLLRYAGYTAAAAVFFLQVTLGRALLPGPSFAALAALTFLALYVSLYFGEGLIPLADLRATLKRISSVLSLEEKGPSYIRLLKPKGELRLVK